MEQTLHPEMESIKQVVQMLLEKYDKSLVSTHDLMAVTVNYQLLIKYLSTLHYYLYSFSETFRRKNYADFHKTTRKC